MRHRKAKTRPPRRADLAHADLRRYRGSWWLALVFTVLGAGGLATAVGFGATSYVFRITPASILVFSVDPDTQLALLGFVNSALSMLVTTSLEQAASLWITRGMISPAGVGLDDLELGDELTKPWKALTRFARRWRTAGAGGARRAAGWGRLALALATSGSLLGLGVAINTIGMPKNRWCAAVDTALPMTTLRSIDWGIFGDRAAAFAGPGATAATVTAMQYALLAANAFEALMALPAAMARTPHGWTGLSLPNPDVPPAAMALDTRRQPNSNGTAGSTSRGYAWQAEVLVDLFQYMQAHGDGLARRAIGMTGTITIAAPTVAVTCGAFRPDEWLAEFDGVPWNGTIFTNSTLADAGAPLVQVSLKPLPASNFSGCTCDLAVGRLLFPSSAWIVNTDGVMGDVAFSADGYGSSVYATPALLPYDVVDTQMAHQLVLGLSIVFDRFDRFVAATTGGALLLQAARAVQAYRHDFAGDDAAAAAPVLANLANHLVSVAGWGYNHTANLTVDASLSQVRWQVYGSSPRLAWEWAASIILALLMAALAAAVALMLRLRIAPGDWLKPAGMLVAANLSGRLDGLARRADQGEPALAAIRLRLAKVPAADAVALVDDAPAWRKPPLIGRDYAWAEG